MKKLAFLSQIEEEIVYLWTEMVVWGDDRKNLKSKTDL